MSYCVTNNPSYHTVPPVFAVNNNMSMPADGIYISNQALSFGVGGSQITQYFITNCREDYIIHFKNDSAKKVIIKTPFDTYEVLAGQTGHFITDLSRKNGRTDINGYNIQIIIDNSDNLYSYPAGCMTGYICVLDDNFLNCLEYVNNQHNFWSLTPTNNKYLIKNLIGGATNSQEFSITPKCPLQMLIDLRVSNSTNAGITVTVTRNTSFSTIVNKSNPLLETIVASKISFKLDNSVLINANDITGSITVLPLCLENIYLSNKLMEITYDAYNKQYNFGSIDFNGSDSIIQTSYRSSCYSTVLLQVVNTSYQTVNITVNNNKPLFSDGFVLSNDIWFDYIDIKPGDIISINSNTVYGKSVKNSVVGFIKIQNRQPYCIQNYKTLGTRRNAYVNYYPDFIAAANTTMNSSDFLLGFNIECNNTIIDISIANGSKTYNLYLESTNNPLIKIAPGVQNFYKRFSGNIYDYFSIKSDNYNGEIVDEGKFRVKVTVVSASGPTPTPTPSPSFPTPTPTSTSTPTPQPSSTYCGNLAPCIGSQTEIPSDGFIITGLCAGEEGYYFLNNASYGQVVFEMFCDGQLHVQITNENSFNTAYAIIDTNKNYIKKSNPYNNILTVNSGDTVKIQYLDSDNDWKNGQLYGKVYFILPTPTPTPSITLTPASTASTPTPTPTVTSSSSCECLMGTAFYGTITTGDSNCEFLYKPTNVLSSKYEDLYYFEVFCDGYLELIYSATQRFKYVVEKNKTEIINLSTFKSNATGHQTIQVTSGDKVLIKLFADGFAFQENQFNGLVRFVNNQPTPTPTPSPTPYCGLVIDPVFSSSNSDYTIINPCSYYFDYTSHQTSVTFDVTIDGFITIEYDSLYTDWMVYKISFYDNPIINVEYTENITGNISFPVSKNDSYIFVVGSQLFDNISAFRNLKIKFTWTEFSPTPTPTPSNSPTPSPTGSTPTPQPTKMYHLISYGYNKDAQCGLGYVSDGSTNFAVDTVNIFAASSTPWKVLGKNKTSASAITEDGKLFVWGSNAYNKLGSITSSTTPYSVPTQILENVQFKQSSDGKNFMLYLSTDGDIWGCGNNSSGQLGLGNLTSISSPVILLAGGAKKWSKIDTGLNFSVGLKNDGTLWSWGDNTYGQLGLGDYFTRYTPTQIIQENGVWVDFAVGLNHVVAKRRKSNYQEEFYSWGGNSQGQLGTNDTNNYNLPVLIKNAYSWDGISCGDYSNYAWNYNLNRWPASSLSQYAPMNPVYNYNFTHTWGTNEYKKLYQKMDDLSNINSVLLPTTIQKFNNWTNKFSDPYVDSTEISASANNAAILTVDQKEFVIGKDDYFVKNPIKTFDYKLSKVSMGDGFVIGLPSQYDVPISTPMPTFPCIKVELNSNFINVPYSDSEGGGYKYVLNESFYSSSEIKYTLNCVNTYVKITGTKKTPDANAYIKISYLGEGGYFAEEYLLALNETQEQIIPIYYYGTLIEIFVEPTSEEKSIPAGSVQGVLKIIVPDQLPTSTPDATFDATNAPTPTPMPTPYPTLSNSLVVWGDNTLGQLGDSTVISKSKPFQLGSEKNWSDVAAGGNFSIGLKNDNKLYSWGNNSFGQLGHSNINNTSSPNQILSSEKWIAVDAGQRSSAGLQKQPATPTPTLSPTPLPTETPCATLQGSLLYRQIWAQNIKLDGFWKDMTTGAGIKMDGTLWTWNSSNTTNANLSSTVQEPLLATDWSQVSGNYFFRCAIKKNGKMFCWGRNEFGQTGVLPYRYEIKSPTIVTLDASNWKMVSCGFDYTLALKNDGTMWGMGRNDYFSLGNNSFDRVTTPIQVGLGTSDWKKVVAGIRFSAAIKNNNSLWMWGRNDNGYLGLNDTISRKTPVEVGGTDWVEISCGDFSAYGVKTDGTVWGWGLFTNFNVAISSPVQIGQNTNGWKNVELNFGIKEDGKIWQMVSDGATFLSPVVFSSVCGGVWSKLDVADGFTFLSGPTPTPSGTEPSPTPSASPTPTPTSTPTASPIPTPLPTESEKAGYLYAVTTKNNLYEQVGGLYKKISGNGFYAFYGIKDDNTLWYLYLSPNGSLTSRQVGASNDWSDVWQEPSKAKNNFAIKTDGTLWAWGVNNQKDAGWWMNSPTDTTWRMDGIFGNNSIISSLSPVQVGLDTTWGKISAGVTHTAAIKKDGTLWTWGSNSYGQLGDSTYTSRSSPIQVDNGWNDWTDVCCIDGTTFGIRLNGSIFIWGLQKWQLMDQRKINSPIKSKIVTIGWESIKGVSFGSRILFLHRNGTVWTTGSDNDGSLGLNKAWSNFPMEKIGLDEIKKIQVGLDSSFCIDYSNRMFSWGRNRGVLSMNPPVYRGLLGDGSTENRSQPVAIPLKDGSWLSAGLVLKATLTPEATDPPTPTPSSTAPTPTPTSTETTPTVTPTPTVTNPTPTPTLSPTVTPTPTLSPTVTPTPTPFPTRATPTPMPFTPPPTPTYDCFIPRCEGCQDWQHTTIIDPYSPYLEVPNVDQYSYAYELGKYTYSINSTSNEIKCTGIYTMTLKLYHYLNPSFYDFRDELTFEVLRSSPDCDFDCEWACGTQGKWVPLDKTGDPRKVLTRWCRCFEPSGSCVAGQTTKNKPYKDPYVPKIYTPYFSNKTAISDGPEYKITMVLHQKDYLRVWLRYFAEFGFLDAKVFKVSLTKQQFFQTGHQSPMIIYVDKANVDFSTLLGLTSELDKTVFKSAIFTPPDHLSSAYKQHQSFTIRLKQPQAPYIPEVKKFGIICKCADLTSRFGWAGRGSAGVDLYKDNVLVASIREGFRNYYGEYEFTYIDNNPYRIDENGEKVGCVYRLVWRDPSLVTFANTPNFEGQIILDPYDNYTLPDNRIYFSMP